MVKILLVDDHAIVRAALRLMIKEILPDALIDESGDAYGAMEQTGKTRYDLIILDMGLGEIHFNDLLAHLSRISFNTRILVFTHNRSEYFAESVLRRGAYGYLSKTASELEVQTAIQMILSGKKYVPIDTQEDTDNPFRLLSEKEFELMMLIAKGESPMQIARVLNIKPSTVATHTKNIFRKLGVHSKAALTVLALKHKLWM